MKNSAGIRQLSIFFLLTASLCPVLAACSGMNMEDLAAGAEPARVTTASTPTPQLRPQYPNLNLATTPAAPQITVEERQQIIDELSAKRGGVSAGPSAASVSEVERLKQLARQSQQETLNTIESAQ
jgi:hypothetical protein